MSSEGQLPPTLRSLVGHRQSVEAHTPLEEVHRRFAETGLDFLAVLEGERLIGVCGRRDIAMKLGARFGFALYARRPVSESLLAAPLIVNEMTPIHEIFSRIAAKTDAFFYDDVVLVDVDGRFLGLIYVHALVRLQTSLLLGNISALESSRREIADKNRLMEEDLLMAREVQLAMLPMASQDEPARLWSFHAAYTPAGGVSGDFYQLLALSDSEAGVLVCDVMGHGVRSALVTAMLRAFAEELRAVAREPGSVLTRLNQSLMGVLRQTGNLLFVTAAYVYVDAVNGMLSYGQAGHPTGYIIRGQRKVELMPVNDEVAGPALGLIDDMVYSHASCAFAAGDEAVLFTDGISEARSSSGEEWGEDRLREELGRKGDAPGKHRLERVVEAARNFAGVSVFDDDVCLVSLSRKP